MQFDAIYFDGQSAGSVEGRLQVLASGVHFHAGSMELQASVNDSTMIAPVGQGAWIIELQGGGSIHVRDPEAGALLATAYRQSRFVERLEKSWPWAVTALVVAIAGTWAFLTFGVPVVAREAAFAVPDEIDASLGSESMKLLDDYLFEDSSLPADRKAQVRSLFDSIPGEDGEAHSYVLHFRSSPSVGANAFAIPGGQVVITDEMIELAESDAELLGVLAHEIGHLVNRHGLRIVLQDSLSALLIASLTGDITNVSALAASVPTLLMQAKYSRDFEREADDYAFAYLSANGLDTDVLSELLQRIEEEYGVGDDDDGVSSWLSSHPRSEDRLPEGEP